MADYLDNMPLGRLGTTADCGGKPHSLSNLNVSEFNGSNAHSKIQKTSSASSPAPNRRGSQELRSRATAGNIWSADHGGMCSPKK